MKGLETNPPVDTHRDTGGCKCSALVPQGTHNKPHASYQTGGCVVISVGSIPGILPVLVSEDRYRARGL